MDLCHCNLLSCMILSSIPPWSALFPGPRSSKDCLGGQSVKHYKSAKRTKRHPSWRNKPQSPVSTIPEKWFSCPKNHFFRGKKAETTANASKKAKSTGYRCPRSRPTHQNPIAQRLPLNVNQVSPKFNCCKMEYLLILRFKGFLPFSMFRTRLSRKLAWPCVFLNSLRDLSCRAPFWGLVLSLVFLQGFFNRFLSLRLPLVWERSTKLMQLSTSLITKSYKLHEAQINGSKNIYFQNFHVLGTPFRFKNIQRWMDFWHGRKFPTASHLVWLILVLTQAVGKKGRKKTNLSHRFLSLSQRSLRNCLSEVTEQCLHRISF